MKKLIAILSAMLLSLSVANAQQNGPGEGEPTPDGDGPFGPKRYMWEYISNEAPDEIKATLAQIQEQREILATVRANYENLEAFRAAHEAEIQALKDLIAQVQSWWRDNRPDRPDPVVVDSMVQRRHQYRIQAENIANARRQLRQMDPSDEGYQQLREQLRQSLGERKQLLRDQRRGEGTQGGDSDPRRGPGG